MTDKAQRKTPAHFFIMGYQIDEVWLTLNAIALFFAVCILRESLSGEDNMTHTSPTVQIESE